MVGVGGSVAGTGRPLRAREGCGTTRRGPITPVELASASEAYRRSGTFAEAARVIGRDESTVRRALARAGAPERAEVMAAELDRAQREVLAALAAARVRLVEALGATADAREVAGLAAALADQCRALVTARMAEARLAERAAAAEEPPRVSVLEARAALAAALSGHTTPPEPEPPELTELGERLRRALHSPCAACGAGRDDAPVPPATA